LDDPRSRWAEVVEGREVVFERAVREAAQVMADDLEREPERVRVASVKVQVGDMVTAGQALVETLRPRASVLTVAPSAGKVVAVTVVAGQFIAPGKSMVEIEAPETTNAEGKTVAGVVSKVGAPRRGEGVETPLPLGVLVLGEDVERLATSALEAELVARHWVLESRGSLSAAMSQSDLRSMLDQLWSRVDPSDIFERHGVDRLAFGRVVSVAYPGPDRCEVELEMRALDASGALLFTTRGAGKHGPEPGFADWVGEHPWRAAGCVLLAIWILLALFTRGHAVPYLERHRQETKDRAAFEEGRKASGVAQEVLVDMRRLQDDAANRGRVLIATQLGDQVDRLDQVRRRLETTSRDQDRMLAASGLRPAELVVAVGGAVRRFPNGGTEDEEQLAVDEIARTIDVLRRAVHEKTNI
jgi:pyruvate/2-oxoglutarate dehydrogenase complex dihydrolipoamide acyltransferase (E2) component